MRRLFLAGVLLLASHNAVIAKTAADAAAAIAGFYERYPRDPR